MVSRGSAARITFSTRAKHCVELVVVLGLARQVARDEGLVLLVAMFPVLARQAFGDGGERRRGVGEDRHLGRVGAGEIGRIEVDADQAPQDAHARIPQVGLGNLAADGEDDVGLAEQLLHRHLRHAAAEIERMAFRHDALAGDGGDDDGAEGLGDGERGGSRFDRAAAQEQQRMLGAGEKGDGTLHRGGIGQRPARAPAGASSLRRTDRSGDRGEPRDRRAAAARRRRRRKRPPGRRAHRRG